MLLLVVTACQAEKNSTTTEENEMIMMENKQLIMQNLERFDYEVYSPENQAQHISEVLTSLDVKKIKTAIIEEQDGSMCVMRIEDEANAVYYLTLSNDGYLGTVRKDSLLGEEIYAGFHDTVK